MNALKPIHEPQDKILQKKHVFRCFPVTEDLPMRNQDSSENALWCKNTESHAHNYPKQVMLGLWAAIGKARNAVGLGFDSAQNDPATVLLHFPCSALLWHRNIPSSLAWFHEKLFDLRPHISARPGLFLLPQRDTSLTALCQGWCCHCSEELMKL